MTVSKKQQASVNKYVKANYDRINVTFPKGTKEALMQHAKSRGESVNAFINRAVDEVMNKEGGYKMVCNETLERRYRYRLGLRGWKLHKEQGSNGPVYFITDGVEIEHNERPDDMDTRRWFTLGELGSFCDELAEKDKLFYEEEREKRKAKRD